MSNLELRVFDNAFAVTEIERAAIMKAANNIMFPLTLTEWVAQARRDESEMIGTLADALDGLCHGACEKAGVHPASKTFVFHA